MSLTSCVLDNPIQITIVIVRPAALSKNDQIWPKIGIFVHFGPGLAGSFGALLVVVARGLYLARHLFTLFTGLPLQVLSVVIPIAKVSSVRISYGSGT